MSHIDIGQHDLSRLCVTRDAESTEAGSGLVNGYPLAAGWRDAGGNGQWTWHSLRHVFCTTALFTWGLDAADVSRMAGHANVRITLDMYVGAVAGVLDRARQATA